MHLGEPAAEHQAGRARRQRLVPQRVDGDHLRPGRGEQLNGLGIAEAERGTPRDRDHRPRPARRRPGRRAPGGRGERPGSGGQRDHRVQVHRVRDQRGETLDGPPRRVRALRRWHQAEVAGRGSDRVVPPQRAQHRDPEAGQRGPQDLLVPGRPDPVQHHPGQSHPRVVGGEPADQRGDGPSLRGRVDDQQHRRAKQPGHVRGRSLGRGAAPVEQAHHSLHHRDVGAGRAVPQQRRDQILAAQHRVQVAARPPGRDRVVPGIDVVGAHLVPGAGQAARPQRRHQAGGHGGLAVPRRGRGDHEARQRHHSMPRWPFWP